MVQFTGAGTAADATGSATARTTLDPVPSSTEPSLSGAVAASTRVASPGRSQRSGYLITTGAALFAAGLLAVAAIMVLFATGSHDLPLWLNLAAMLAPTGFGLGLIDLLMDARAHRRGARPVPVDRSGS